MSGLEQYYKRQNEEQRQVLDEKDKYIKSQNREIYEVKQSIYKELVEIRKIGQSNDIHKNIKMLDRIEKLINDLHFDIQEEQKELISDWQSQN